MFSLVFFFFCKLAEHQSQGEVRIKKAEKPGAQVGEFPVGKTADASRKAERRLAKVEVSQDLHITTTGKA
jgi:hypothetical protein